MDAALVARTTRSSATLARVNDAPACNQCFRGDTTACLHSRMNRSMRVAAADARARGAADASDRSSARAREHRARPRASTSTAEGQVPVRARAGTPGTTITRRARSRAQRSRPPRASTPHEMARAAWRSNHARRRTTAGHAGHAPKHAPVGEARVMGAHEDARSADPASATTTVDRNRRKWAAGSRRRSEEKQWRRALASHRRQRRAEFSQNARRRAQTLMQPGDLRWWRRRRATNLARAPRARSRARRPARAARPASARQGRARAARDAAVESGQKRFDAAAAPAAACERGRRRARRRRASREAGAARRRRSIRSGEKSRVPFTCVCSAILRFAALAPTTREDRPDQRTSGTARARAAPERRLRLGAGRAERAGRSAERGLDGGRRRRRSRAGAPIARELGDDVHVAARARGAPDAAEIAQRGERAAA